MRADDTMTLSEMEQINRIILGLYDDSQPYHTRVTNFFQSVMDLVYFDKASLLFFVKDHSGNYQKRHSITLNWDSSLLDAYDKGLYRYDDTLEPVDKPFQVLLRSSTYFSGQHREQSPFWKEYQLPSNAPYEIFGNVLLPQDKQLKCKLCFARSEAAQDFTVSEVRIIRLFQPHLSTVTQQNVERSSEAETSFESYNCIGTCVLNGRYQLVRSNSVFDSLNQRVDGRLQEKIKELCINLQNSQGDSPGKMISCEYKLADEPIFLEIISSGQTEPGPGRAAAQYDCLVYDLSHFFSSALRQAKVRFKLTDREFDILSLMLQGLRYEDISSKLYLSVPSIKKHVVSVYSKMGISSQKQIISKLSLF